MIDNLWLRILGIVGMMAIAVASGLVITALTYLLMQICFDIRDTWRRRKRR